MAYNSNDIPKQPGVVIDKSAAVRIATSIGWQPPRQWVGLTNEEAVEVMRQVPHLTIGGLLAVEAKLKEKNNG